MRIFVSYRRADTAAEAGRLVDRLTAHFGSESVFMDLDGVAPGEDFIARIEEGIAAADVVLAIIGPAWSGRSRWLGRPRLRDPADVVRLELETALASGTQVIPVLVGGARMPDSDDLPGSLAPLLRRNAHELSEPRWRYDADRLIAVLDPEGGKAEYAAPPVENPIEPGTRVLQPGDRYAGLVVDETIGRGSASLVYKATPLAARAAVALKVVSPRLSGDDDFRRAFLRDFEQFAGIVHPNLLKLIRAGEEGGSLYVVSELVDGPDLDRVIRRESRLEPAEAVRVAYAVAEAVGACHARGTLHGNLTPARVLLSEGDGRVVLGGLPMTLARPEWKGSGVTMSGWYLGSPGHMAPEVIAGRPRTVRSDVYLIGLMIFEALAGAPPFRGESPIDTMYLQLQEPPPALAERIPGVGRDFDDVIRRALAKDPEDRFPSVAALAAALQTISLPKAKRPPQASKTGGSSE